MSRRQGFSMTGIGRFFPAPSLPDVSAVLGQIRNLAELYIGHRFDLLGSGWMQVVHGMRCRGVEGHRYDKGTPVTSDSSGEWLRDRVPSNHLARSQHAWGKIDPGYVPIDWQLDFK